MSLDTWSRRELEDPRPLRRELPESPFAGCGAPPEPFAVECPEHWDLSDESLEYEPNDDLGSLHDGGLDE